jgi:hypothetical protein
VIVVAKLGLAWLAWQAWASLPERPGFVGNWHIQLGTVGEWLGAIFTALAVAVALGIAGHESRTRRRERDDADHAQARLVQVKVKPALPDFDVEIRNYGDRAIIGPAAPHAWWFAHPEYSWRHSDPEHDRVRIVPPNRDAPSGGSVRVRFFDAEGNIVPKEIGVTELMERELEDIAVMPDAVVVFMDANGSLWETGSSIAPRRIKSPPVKW